MVESKPKKIALYRKYRPQDFANLVGQEHIQSTLQNGLASGKVAHAYLFCGPRGTGKTSTARLIAKGLNCLNLSAKGEPCNTCENCQEIAEGHMLDVIEIDAASNRGVDEIRDLREKVKFSPSRGKKKVFIIDEVHMLTKEAFNALLKTLEEPPEHAHFILATTETHKVPATIISRCQRFDFRRLQAETIAERLAYIAAQENVPAEQEALLLIAKAADGGMRDAISLFEQLVNKKGIQLEQVQQNLGLVNHQIIADFITFLEAGNAKAASKLIDQIYLDGIDLKQFSKACLETLRDKMLRAVSQGEQILARRYLRFIEILQDNSTKLKNSDIPQLPLELSILSIVLENPGPSTEPSVKENIPAPLPAVVAETVEFSVTTPTSELNLSHLKEQWGAIVNQIQTPAIKLALKKASLGALDAQGLRLQLSSKFELEKLKGQRLHEIEEALQKVLGVKISVNLQYNPEVPATAPNTDSNSQYAVAQDIFLK